MNLGEFFIKLGVQGDTKELDKTISQMEKAEKRSRDLIKYRKDLAKATSESEKALVKKNFADKIQLDNLKKQQQSIKQNQAGWAGLAKGVLGFVAVASIAYKATERMVTSLAQANQQMITFQRTTGISFQSLNKYASASASVNFNSTVEGTAQTMSRLANNLWDIRMGRGDISPYQELAFVGGKAFNPMGMSVEQVIEQVREAIKGVDDLQATNIIQRMGFAPDDLLMLRMSRAEFEKVNDLFLNPQQREAMNKYALELKKVKLEFDLLKDKALLKIVPIFVKIAEWLSDTTQLWAQFANNIIKAVQANEWLVKSFKVLGIALVALLAYANPVVAVFTALYLIIEDIVGAFMGYKSVTGLFLNKIGELADKMQNFFSNLRPPEWITRLIGWFSNNTPIQPNANGEYMSYMTDKPLNMTPINTSRYNNSSSNVNTNNNFVINSNQPIQNIVPPLINHYTPTQVQFSPAGI